MNYKYNDKTQLSEHFNAQEFRCKCGGTHDIIINPDLVSKLEQLFAALDCSKIIVNSGHRCSSHDIAVGGYGSGQHVSGNAADIVCYDKAGNKISSKIVCCKAQDIGFRGIANIDDTYTATHVDVRASGIWYGDEVVTTTASVTDNFYSYYNIQKSAAKSTKSVTLTIDGKTYKGTLAEA